MSVTESSQKQIRHAAYFEEFFDLGLEETASPFLTPESRKWGKNLPLKASIAASILLLLSFVLQFYPQMVPISRLTLIGVYFLVGIPSLIESLEDLSHMEINIDMLMTIAAFSSVFIGSGMEGGLLLVLFAISGAMEQAVKKKAESSISHLSKIAPTLANVVTEDGLLVERSVKDILVGTKILIKAGTVVPLDGKIIEGTSSLNFFHMTGENVPVRKIPGDEVPAGAQNIEGALKVKVTRTSSNSTLERIIQLVTKAKEAKPKLQRWFDSLSRRYAITIISLAAFFTLLFPIVFSMPILGVEGSLYRSLAFLIAASPCALILAIPIAYLSAISSCAKNGILLKGGIALDALASCTAIAFDKTGTLTTGDLRLLNWSPVDDEDRVFETLVLPLAYALEQNALHPIAKAIQKSATEKSILPYKIKNFQAIPGYGLKAQATIDDKIHDVLIGHIDFIAEKIESAKATKLKEMADVVKEDGFIVAALKIGDCIFLMQFEDSPRPKIKTTLDALKNKRKMQLIMLTGDHAKVARKIAKDLQIDTVLSELKPEDKLKYVSKFSVNKGLAMVGDGINDAPALARATVGIGMGKVGSNAAIDASDIVLLQDNIELLDWLVKKAFLTKRIVKQNLIVATCAIIFASLPALAGYVPLWLAVILHEGGTVLVGLNALRLLRK